MKSKERVPRLLDALRDRGERMTIARRALLEVLAGAHGHLSAEEILAAVQRQHPEIHRATVYRTLETLDRLGIVEHTHLGHGPAAYHLADDVHQHLVCEVCGAVVEVPSTLFRGIEQRLQRDYGFVMRPFHFAVVGRCRRCA
jgi:Fur family ferric uptake transcriptional regulator